MAVLAAGCQRVGAPLPVAMPACRAPRVASDDWSRVRDTLGVAYRVPSDFVERPSGDLPYREWAHRTDPSGRLAIGLSPSREFWLTLRRSPSPGMMEMSECIGTLADERQVLLQSWRTVNGIFRDGRRYDLFEVMALVAVEPTRTLYVTGGGSAPEMQELVLAIARTVTVEAP